MDAGNQNDGLESVDRIHAAAIADANAGAEAAPEVETPGDNAGPAPGGPGPNSEFCKETLQRVAEWHAEAIHAEIYSQLKPHCSHDQAERIARKAALSPAMQEAFAKSGAAVLDKYGWARFVGPEGELLVIVLLYLRGLMSARRDVAKILKSPVVTQGGAS